MVRGSKGTIKQVMADAFLLIMAVSLGTISYLVAREVAKRILYIVGTAAARSKPHYAVCCTN